MILAALLPLQLAHADGPITHQITLTGGASWCSDTSINTLFDLVNAQRALHSIPALQMDAVGMKDAETRAVQFAAYMATHPVGSTGFNPHTGYDTTAAGLGYNIISEDLAWMTSDPTYIVDSGWQDTLHLAAMLASDANIAGVSCILDASGIPYWTYEPGCSANFCGQSFPPSPSPAPNPTPSPSPSPGTPTLDSEESNFLTLINNYRAQNGAGPLQVSLALENSSLWMANDMATNNYASHTDSLGRTPGTRFAAFGYPYAPWGENIAGGFQDAQSVFTGFENACDPDPTGACTYGHRQNMLNPAFQVIGIGRAFGANSAYGWYWTTDFGGVVDQLLNPTPGPSAPSITSFTASPASITSGQSTNLLWSVSGATALTLSNGIGSVIGLTSKQVMPTQTTTYTLTASNTSGSTSASVTVTVTAPNPPPDTQPPTIPTLVTASAKSSTEVDLTWMASSDNVAVTSYRVLRSGTLIATVNALAYSDTVVTAGATYIYSIEAGDAAGNWSAQSNVMAVSTPSVAPPPSNPCPAPATNAFTGCYYGTLDLSGSPVLVRTDPQINFNWSSNPPASAVPQFNFSARWQGNFNFAGGTYTFTTTTSDGMIIFVDSTMILDRWRDQSPFTYAARVTIPQGMHLITVDYYEHSGTPVAQVTWQNQALPPTPSPTPAPTLPVISMFAASPTVITAGSGSTLAWSVSGATGLTLDNGIGSVLGLTSKVVSPAQTTTYTLTAANTAGTVTAHVTVTVNAPPPQPSPNPAPNPPPSSNPCPGPATNAFTGCYYNSTNLTGSPALVRTDPQINFNWSAGPPAPAVSQFNFSALWQGNFNFAAGTYTFHVTTSDGMMIYVDNTMIFDRWRDQGPTGYTARVTLTSGTHLVRVEYYEHTGTPVAQVSWTQN